MVGAKPWRWRRVPRSIDRHEERSNLVEATQAAAEAKREQDLASARLAKAQEHLQACEMGLEQKSDALEVAKAMQQARQLAFESDPQECLRDPAFTLAAELESPVLSEAPS